MYLEFHPEAEQELSEHALYYEGRLPGLGERFIDRIETGSSFLLINPLIGPQFEGEFRHLVLDEFPFSLIYRVESERILILAVAHQSRRPRYWQERILR